MHCEYFYPPLSVAVAWDFAVYFVYLRGEDRGEALIGLEKGIR